ncbi:MAG: DoxX subfamily [Bacteroidetes bacterium]|nr:DoxX family membrane protein [Bacteroidales bacterium]RLD95962.1 MAG: DoxX subfamily [Bacteroidota bacterium]
MEIRSKELKWQQGTLVALRFLIGWHFLYEGLHKLIHPEWSSLGFLANSQWIFSGLSEWIISNSAVLNTVDALNTWGLIAIGLGLILGLFTRAASISGALLLLLYYLFNPPFIGMDLSGPMEGNYLMVNKTLIEAVALLYLAVTPLSRSFGLDTLRKKYNT